jgi:two-component system CheB/CheR fusion protein
MQSLNEELETSKEELQSTNEELISLNQELIEKQEQYNAAINYSEAIVRTIKEPLLVLDKDLYIKSANDSFYNKFNTTNTEVEGRLFYEIQNGRWNTHELRNLLENILPQKSVMEDFEMIIDERIILLSAREITSEKDAEQLILLSIVDVTDTRLAKKLQISESRLREFIMQAPVMLALLKEPEHRFELINPLFTQFLGNREIVGKKLFEAIPEFKGQGIIELIDTVYKTGATFSSNEMPVMVENGNEPEQFYLNFTFQAYKNEEGKTEGILVFVYDVTAQVTVRKIIEESETSMRQMASHLKLATDSANVGTWFAPPVRKHILSLFACTNI